MECSNVALIHIGIQVKFSLIPRLSHPQLSSDFTHIQVLPMPPPSLVLTSLKMSVEL